MYLLSTGSQKQDSIIQNKRLKCVSDLLSINEKNKNLVIFWFLSLGILFFDSRHLSNIYLILHYSQKKAPCQMFGRALWMRLWSMIMIYLTLDFF